MASPVYHLLVQYLVVLLDVVMDLSLVQTVASMRASQLMPFQDQLVLRKQELKLTLNHLLLQVRNFVVFEVIYLNILDYTGHFSGSTPSLTRPVTVKPIGSTPSIGSGIGSSIFGTESGSGISTSSGSSSSTIGGGFTTPRPGGSLVFISKETKDSPLTSGSFYDRPGSGQFPIPSSNQQKPIGPIPTGSGINPSDKDGSNFGLPGPGTGGLPIDGSSSSPFGGTYSTEFGIGGSKGMKGGFLFYIYHKYFRL